MAGVGQAIHPDDLNEALGKVQEAIEQARQMDDTIPEFTWTKPLSGALAIDLLTDADTALTEAAEKYQSKTCNTNNSSVNSSKYSVNNTTQYGTVKKSKTNYSHNTYCLD